MKPIYALLCVAFLVADRPLQSRGDELDDLLSSEASELQIQSPPDAVQAGLAYEAQNGDALDYTDHSRWHSPVVMAPVSRAAKSARPAKGATQKPAPPAGLNIVPEPSAIALGVLALLYFLVFGRRRRLA